MESSRADDGFWEEHNTPVTDEEIQEAVETSDDDRVVCRECGVEFSRVNTPHLDRIHGMTLEEYRALHPEAPTVPLDRLVDTVVNTATHLDNASRMAPTRTQMVSVAKQKTSQPETVVVDALEAAVVRGRLEHRDGYFRVAE